MINNEIPKGHYCYEVISIDAYGKMKLKTCPHWSSILVGTDRVGYCSHLGIGDAESSESQTFLWDKVKECGINMGYEGN